jgi:hypothetical protein
MDYDNPQFTAAVKKVMRNFIAPEPQVYADDTQDNANDERDNTPITTVSELRTQIPIRVKTETEESKPERIWKWVKGALEVLGILAVIFYTVLANKQWHEMISARHQTQRAVEINDRSAAASEQQARDADAALANSDKFFRRDQRAYVSVKDPVLHDPQITSQQAVVVSFHLINTGKTPAEFMQHFGLVSLQKSRGWDGEEKAFASVNPNKPSRLDIGAPIPPNASDSFFSISTLLNGEPPKWTPDEVTDILSGKRFIYAAGTVEYSDVFSERHTSEFCARWSVSHGDWEWCTLHNHIE